MLLIFLIFGSGLQDLFTSLDSVRTANKGNAHLLGTTNVFLVLQYLASVIPYVMDLGVVHLLMNLLSVLREDRYSEEAVRIASVLSRFCGFSLIIVTLSGVALNLAQLLFLKNLFQINTDVQIPLFSVLFVLAALLLAQFIREAKQLQDDNDLFI